MQRPMLKLAGTLAVRCAAALTLMAAMTTPQNASADQADAERLLKAMSDYLAVQDASSFKYDTILEVVTKDLQKLALASSGTIAVKQPDKVRASRTGGFADVELIFDGTTLTLFGKDANVYGEVEIPGTIDHLIDELRNAHGKLVPGADLLASNVYDALMSSAVDLKDLGSGVISGVECDHLAGRAEEVDWQIWIAQGQHPYPCRYVVTSRLVTGAPQYSVSITDWKVDDQVASVDFTFANTTGAQLQDLSDMSDTDELPGIFAVGGSK